ncbi:MarR family winged helix-turn-helix transcriptional regulator [Streptomyces krungchingensis]
MTTKDSALTALAHEWCTLALLHGRIEAQIERVLQARHGLSMREFCLLYMLSRQRVGGHMQIKQVADAVVLSASAASRLVTRLEDQGLLQRFLHPADRRGICTDITDAGHKLLDEARPTSDAVLREALGAAAQNPALAPLVKAIAAGCLPS